MFETTTQQGKEKAQEQKESNKEDIATDEKMYQRFVGILISLSHTRPDIAYTVR